MIDRAKLFNAVNAAKPWFIFVPKIIGGLGTVVMAAALVSQDPYEIVLVLSVAELFFLVGIAASYLITEEAPASPIIQEAMPESSRRKSVPVVIRNFLIAMALVIPCVIITVWNTYDFDAVQIGAVDIWMPRFEIVDGREYRTGAIGAHDGSKTSYFFPGPYYLTFRIQKAKRHTRVDVDGIVVTVLEYTPPKPKDEIQVWTALPMDQETLFLVEIDDPKAGKRSFNCDRVFQRENGEYKSERFAASYIDHNNPEKIVIKIDAKKPGIYKFKVELQVSVGLSQSTVPVQTETVYYPPEKKAIESDVSDDSTVLEKKSARKGD